MHTPIDPLQCLYALPEPDHAVSWVPPADWLQALASTPKVNMGELEDTALIQGVVPAGWRCAVLPEYILPHVCVACVQAVSGQYAMLFFHKVGVELHKQERPPLPGLIGWFQVRLIKPITDLASLTNSLCHAFEMLRKKGLIET